MATLPGKRMTLIRLVDGQAASASLSPRCARSAPASPWSVNVFSDDSPRATRGILPGGKVLVVRGYEGVSDGGPVMDLDVLFSPRGILSIEATPISR